MRKPPSLHDLEITISHILRSGLAISGVLLCIGWVWMWTQGKDISQNFTDYQPQALIHSLQWGVIMQDRALLISLTGLMILVLLPIFRVFMTAILFVWQKDFRMAGVALAVFAVLFLSLFLGIDL